jgi:hypothetical protein
MADYNPSGRTRLERQDIQSGGQDLSSNNSRSDTNWAEFELNVRDVMLELGDLLIKKHKDYGPKNISNSPYGATNGLVVRMWDKIARIVNLTKDGKKVTAENEPLEDSFKDIANYGIIGLLVLRGKWDN